MGNDKSKTIDKSTTAQASAQSKDTKPPPPPPQRMNIRMVQNVLLIWLDDNIDEGNADYRDTITELRGAVHTIHQHTDEKECIEFLQSIDNDNVCLVISDSLGRHVVPKVHDMFQVDSIFIFCANKKFHEQWVKEWPKLKGVFTEIGPLCAALKVAARRCEQDAMPISIMATTTALSKKNLDQLDPSFMYTQILKEILLSIKFEQQHIDEFIQYCQEVLAGNKDEIKNLTKFEGQYRKQTPIWWYTYQSFLYPMLKRALSKMDADLIVRMGFFIGDLHRHIEQLHQQQFIDLNSKKSFTVYCGQGLPKADFEKLSVTKGGLLSFNRFLSTSNQRKCALPFAHKGLAKAEMVGVLFVMTIDPSQSNTPFASITDVSCYGAQEDEVLFSMHTVFRIGEITPIDGSSCLFEVTLTLTSDNDKDLRVLMDRIHEETFPNKEGWYRLGQVLNKMGQFDKAQQIYEILLEQTTDELEKGGIYNQLGQIYDGKGEYKEAITFFEKSLAIDKKTLRPTHPDLATSYSNIGNVYRSMGDYPQALSSHEKALAIRQQSLPLNRPNLATSYGNIGNVHQSMGNYLQALSSYEKDLEITKQSLPPNHPDLAVSYNNIAMAHESMGAYPQALSSHKKALDIKEKSLPLDHPSLANSYNNIGIVYRSINDYPQALSSLGKALAIRQRSLPSNHPSLAMSWNNIGLVYEKMKNYSEARSFYERAVDIAQRSLSSDHPELKKWRNNLERMKKQL